MRSTVTFQCHVEYPSVKSFHDMLIMSANSFAGIAVVVELFIDIAVFKIATVRSFRTK